MKLYKWIGLGFILLILSLSTIATAHTPLPTSSVADLQLGGDDDWVEIVPEGDAVCARGTPYSFFVRPAADDQVMIHFQGGGACANEASCSQSPLQTFDDVIDEDDFIQFRFGLFDHNSPENPVSDYTTVIVPYCTGDLHMGNASAVYGEVEIEHRGATNAQAVLDWVYENYPTPSDVFINGCSAGSYGSIFHAPQIIAQYPDATIAHLGDSGVGVSVGDGDGLRSWGVDATLGEYYPDLAETDLDNFRVDMMYESIAAQYPNITFSQSTSRNDATQRSFYQFGGGQDTTWATEAQNSLEALDAFENFSYFVIDGEAHCLIPRPSFYAYQSEDVRFVDWVADLAAGEPVESIGYGD